MLSITDKNVAWRVVSYTEQKEIIEDNEEQAADVKKYAAKVCDDILWVKIVSFLYKNLICKSIRSIIFLWSAPDVFHYS